jgi:hypothetical protein
VNELEASAAKITNWFIKVKAASLILPDGWFGAPMDNNHRLNDVTVRDESLVILFDQHQNITMSTPLSVTSSQSSLILASPRVIAWKWVEYGSTKTHEQNYDGGTIEFRARVVRGKL